MATPLCIPKEIINDVKNIVESTDSSIERVKKISKIVGEEQAQGINLLYENKLLLKNQDKAIEKFINSINGVDIKKKVELKDAIKKRLADRTEKIQDSELLSIAKQIFDKKYDLEIKPEDVKILNSLKKKTRELSKDIEGTPNYSKEREAWADSLVSESEYIETLINPEGNLGFQETIKDILKKTGQRFEDKTNWEKVLESGKVTAEVLTSAVYKSVQASMDASFALRQGMKVLANNPVLWKNNMIEAFKPFTKTMTAKEKYQVMHAFKVKMASNKLYKEALDSKLAIGVVEEFFPTTLAEKIPGVGRIFRSSNDAFTIFSQGSRMDLFKNMMENAATNGTKITPEMSKEFAMLANTITGRGNLGSFEKISGQVNKLFYSGRFIKSQLDTFYLPFKPGLSPEARKIATMSSLKTLSTFAGLMATASMFTDVETDPRSSKFGKMKVPGSEDTWVDLSGGMASYITLAAREAMVIQGKPAVKSATTGKVKKLNTGEFGSQTGGDVLISFFTNKLAPAPGAILDIIEGRTFSGQKPTVVNTVTNLGTPIAVGNMIEMFQNEETGTAFLATMFDLLGAGATDYTKFR